MNYTTHILFVTLTVLIAQGQSKDWRVYTSIDDQFTVEVPSASRIVKTHESKNEATLGPDQRESLASYVSVYEDASTPELTKFRIFVINSRAGLLKSSSRRDLLRYLSIMMIGDDDDPHPTRVRTIKVHGLNGKEYVWDKRRKVFENGSSNEIFTRGRVFDQGDKIYVIVFVSDSSDELRSPTAVRFLNSLRRQKRKG